MTTDQAGAVGARAAAKRQKGDDARGIRALRRPCASLLRRPRTSLGLPDAERRSRQLDPFFSLFVETLLTYDETYTDADLASAALWVPPGEKPTPDEAEEEVATRMTEIAGVDAERLSAVAKVIDEQVWAYLDATSERNKRLYERHGFEGGGEYGPDGGPPLWPMWREPRSRQ
jgi:hypothetical protein